MPGARFAGSDDAPDVRRRPAAVPAVVEAEFPALLGKYERAFDPHGNLSGSYIAALKRRVSRLRAPDRHSVGADGWTVGRSDGRTGRGRTAGYASRNSRSSHCPSDRLSVMALPKLHVALPQQLERLLPARSRGLAFGSPRSTGSCRSACRAARSRRWMLR